MLIVEHAVCGFFFQQIWDYEPFIEDGNSLLFASWKDDYDKKRGAEKEKDAGEYNIYVGQRANSPNEAFTNTQENIFHSPELTNHINAIKYDKSNHFYEDGWYILDDGRVRFVTKQECIERAIFGSDRFHEYITDVPHNSKTDVHGCIREFYSPIPNDGSLYFISYDPYRVDKNKEEVSTKNSLASFQVWMRTNSKTPYMVNDLLLLIVVVLILWKLSINLFFMLVYVGIVKFFMRLVLVNLLLISRNGVIEISY